MIKKIFKIIFFFFFIALNSCSMSLQNIIDSLNYTKNSVDVVSYVATDKTTTDHALSYFFNKDCSIARTLKLKKICEEINRENFIRNNNILELSEPEKVIKKKVVKIKKIRVPSMAY